LVAVRRILARHAGLPVVLLSVIDDCAIIQMGSSAGIHGYLLMEHAVEELVFALETVLKERGRPSATTGYRQPDRVKERHSRRRRSNHESLTGWVSLAAL
jgi:DNA-binding NarL/FixJ family response regulator